MRKIVLFVAMLFSVCAQAQVVTLATLDWPPYIGPGMKNHGYVTEIVKAAFAHTQYEPEIEYMPWARAESITEDGKRDVLFPEYYGEDRKRTHVFSEPFPGGPVGFLKRRDADIQYKRLRDLAQYKIGVVRGYINTEEFDSANYLQKEPVASDLLNIRKLQRGRIDLVVIDRLVAFHTINLDMPNLADEFEFMQPPLENKDLYLAFSKRAPDWEAKLRAFNKGLARIKQDGSMNEILRRHNFL